MIWLLWLVCGFMALVIIGLADRVVKIEAALAQVDSTFGLVEKCEQAHLETLTTHQNMLEKIVAELTDDHASTVWMKDANGQYFPFVKGGES